MNKADKILLILARLCREKDAAIPYEDLVVSAYKAFPDDFGLRGYPEYPDASDIHKPVYNHLKPRGLVRVSNKTFRITDAGGQRAENLERLLRGEASTEGIAQRLTRAQSRAVQRYLRSAAVQLVAEGKFHDLIDTDCQRFYGFAPWTKPNEAAGLRADFLTTLSVLEQIDEASFQLLRKTDEILFERFRNLFGE